MGNTEDEFFRKAMEAEKAKEDAARKTALALKDALKAKAEADNRAAIATNELENVKADAYALQKPLANPQPVQVIRVVVPDSGPRPGTAALIEAIGGFFQVFGLGWMYAGHPFSGIILMFGYWALLAANVFLCFIVIGFITGPLCWLMAEICSPIFASRSCD